MGSYLPEVAADAWSACRGIYLDALRVSVASFDANAEPPQGDAPLAFADCMATLGWVTAVALLGPVSEEDVASYNQANAVCRSPVEGESAETSYCRFLHAIVDRSWHDRSMSVTGTPYMGGYESRRQAAIALYDEALRIAPAELVDDLRTLQDGFRQESEFEIQYPNSESARSAADSLDGYSLSVCGTSVFLGSLD